MVVSAVITAMLILTASQIYSSDSFPEFTAEKLINGEYAKETEKLFTDNFALREKLISVKARLDSQICESISDGVYITDDMLLDSRVSEREENELTPELINGFAENYDGAVYLVAVPTSAGVYGDNLPEYLTYNTEKQQIDNLYGKLGANIRKIDAYNILKMLNENYIYYRSDSKWTSYGAFCVYRTVIQKLGFQPSAYDKYTIEHITDDFRGDLWQRTRYMRSKPDILDIYTYSDGAEVISCIGYDNNMEQHEASLYDKTAVNTNDMYRLYMGEEYPLTEIKTSVNNQKKLLLIKDDYANCFIPFLIQHYSEIAVVSPEHISGSLRDFLNPDDYEQTLFLFGIDSMSNDGLFSKIN